MCHLIIIVYSLEKDSMCSCKPVLGQWTPHYLRARWGFRGGPKPVL